MNKVFLVLLVILGVVSLIVGLSLLFAIPTLLLVNYLFTPAVIAVLFGTAKLTFWKAFWLNFLAGILFKSSASYKNEK